MHSGVTAAVWGWCWIGLTAADTRLGRGRRRRRIERARPSANGIIHVVKPNGRRGSRSLRSSEQMAHGSSNRCLAWQTISFRHDFGCQRAQADIRRRQAAYGHYCLYMTTVIPLNVTLCSLVSWLNEGKMTRRRGSRSFGVVLMSRLADFGSLFTSSVIYWIIYHLYHLSSYWSS